jgi:putative MATE family efflux protein
MARFTSGASIVSTLRSLWASLKEALGGTRQDFTEGSLSRGIALLAIPMVLEMAMESIFAVVDVFFVARLGEDAIATVGLTEGMLTLVYAVAIGLSMGTTAMVARRFGEKDPAAAGTVAVQSILLGLLVAAVVGAAAAASAPRLLALMGAGPGVVAAGAGYTTVLLATNVVIMLIFLNNAVFRGAGDASIAMRALWIANGVNIVLDPCLIFGWGPFPEMGLTGAAVGTSIGRGTGVVYQFWRLHRPGARIRIRGGSWRFDPGVMARLARVSFGGVLQFLVETASFVGLVRIVAYFGSTALAGYTIGVRIIVFAFLPAWGLSNAAATLVGQNLGARKPERAERSVWLTGIYNMLFLGLVSIVFIVFAEPLVRLFHGDAAVVAAGVDCLRIISYGYVFFAWGMVTVQSFNGAGDTMTPTWINLFCFWICQIPLAYYLAHTADMGPRGVFWAIAVCYSLSAVLGILLFRLGRWKTREV